MDGHSPPLTCLHIASAKTMPSIPVGAVFLPDTATTLRNHHLVGVRGSSRGAHAPQRRPLRAFEHSTSPVQRTTIPMLEQKPE